MKTDFNAAGHGLLFFLQTPLWILYRSTANGMATNFRDYQATEYYCTLTGIESPSTFQVVLVAVRPIVTAAHRIPLPHTLGGPFQRLCQILDFVAAPLHRTTALPSPLLDDA